MYDEVLISVQATQASTVAPTTLANLGLQERAHLQEWVIKHPEIIGPGVEIVTSEYGLWETADGVPVANRLDILAVDSDGRLIVVELKRGLAESSVHMQAINYAAMVSRLSLEDVADLYVRFRAGSSPTDPDAARTILETQYLLTLDGIRKPRIVLIAGDFPSSVTASVVWLNEQQVDISLIRFRVYEVAGETLASFNQLFPVPDVEEFTIGRRQTVDSTAAGSRKAETGEPWTHEALEKLSQVANSAPLAMLDLCAAADGESVTVSDIATSAGVTVGSVRGQLAGLTMQLKNPGNGFKQRTWPVAVTWGPGGVANYTMDDELATWWRSIRALSTAPSGGPEQASPTSHSPAVSPPSTTEPVPGE